MQKLYEQRGSARRNDTCNTRTSRRSTQNVQANRWYKSKIIPATTPKMQKLYEQRGSARRDHACNTSRGFESNFEAPLKGKYMVEITKFTSNDPKNVEFFLRASRQRTDGRDQAHRGISCWHTSQQACAPTQQYQFPSQMSRRSK